MNTWTSAPLHPDTTAYLDELAADIAARGGPTGDLLADIACAHSRRQAFVKEMIAGESDRARMARNVLMARVYAAVSARQAAHDAMARCEEIAGAELRHFLLHNTTNLLADAYVGGGE